MHSAQILITIALKLESPKKLAVLKVGRSKSGTRQWPEFVSFKSGL